MELALLFDYLEFLYCRGKSLFFFFSFWGVLGGLKAAKQLNEYSKKEKKRKVLFFEHSYLNNFFV